MLMEQQERIGNEQAEAERAKAELAALEAKIMHGGEHVRDRVTRQQHEIDAREREMNLRLPFTTVLPASSAAHSPSPTLPY